MQKKPRALLQVVNIVAELEIAPKRSEKYNQSIQCEIIDLKKLGKIKEEDDSDSDSENFEQRFSQIQDRRSGSVMPGIVEARRSEYAARPSN